MARFTIRDATPADVEAAVSALAEAFADDPLMAYLYGDDPRGMTGCVKAFFSILLRVRLELDMPAMVLERDGEILGAAMGYDTSRPDWPPSLADEWDRFEAGAPDLPARMAAYDEICTTHQPGGEHYYLGVIGVHPRLQGQGAGKALLDAFCERSRADALSQGVYLDTTNPRSLAFYDRNGFQRRGEGQLDATPVWCVWLPTRP
ncbi:MAG: N-acetyltransferase [Pseudomonadota bacterium]